MIIRKTDISDLLIIEPQVYNDNRGYFFESWNTRRANEAGINFNPIQHNESMSSYGVIRGLHYQLNPFAQSKLVRVVKGRVIDVAVDIRKNSPTYGKHFSIELSEDNKLQFLIPAGFAHGFSVLSEQAILCYLCDNYHNQNSERSIAFNDPTLSINWQIPTEKIIISEKDASAPNFAKSESNF